MSTDNNASRIQHAGALALFLTASVAVNAVAVNAVAESGGGCAPWHDRDRLLLFGDYPLGMPLAELPAELVDPDGCRNPAAPDIIDCEFFGPDGIAYLIDSQGVIRIEARADRAMAADLPLTLRFGDTRATVAAKLNTLPPAAPIAQLREQFGDDSGAWATDFCVFNDGGMAGSWYVEFGADDRLRRVGVRLNAN